MVVIMRSKRYAKSSSGISKIFISLAVVAAVSIISIVGAMANTIPCTVVDGKDVYEFKMTDPDIESILTKAVSEGMKPLGENDRTELRAGVLTVGRSVPVILRDKDTFMDLEAYEGETVQEILANNEIVTAESDEVLPARDEVVTDETDISVDRNKTVYIDDNDSHKKVDTEAVTVGDILREAGISVKEGDKVQPAVDTVLEDKMTVEVDTKKSVNIIINGIKNTYGVFGKTVGEVLGDVGIILDKHDKTVPDLSKKFRDGMDVEIFRVNYKNTVKEEAVEFDTEIIEDEDLLEGTEEVIREGVDGTKEVTYKEKYVNGKVTKSKVIEEKVTEKPVSRQVRVGTRTPTFSEMASTSTMPPMVTDKGGSTFVDMYGNTVSYSSVMEGECTAYSVPGGITSVGLPAQVGVVAVDPNIIPYGTKMYITSGDVVYGYCIAGDTGGAAMAGDILVDLYYDTEWECVDFGRRDMTVYILD